ncbi:hypothetical protein E4K67_00935 [Desulfosporosinus fructosivorans]|uniref:Uncharacterized protein n=1 Tax=Desulfosporosinus fructosivorans TaxID=2018669 RepID=A0A4Z0RBB1_9FIRM|nr:hypothetical protein [Desulfosporosinus fructosivorans]TGE39605.1 hypothetical protein E4K67_00935 [Desulfosporosinus fructosivorans]
MKRKKSKIAALTLTLILLCSTAAYAYTLSGSSNIQTSVSSIDGTSITKTNAVCDEVKVENWLYRDDTFVDNEYETASGSTYAQAICIALNLPGLQYWQLTAKHESTLDGATKKSSSSKSVSY